MQCKNKSHQSVSNALLLNVIWLNLIVAPWRSLHRVSDACLQMLYKTAQGESPQQTAKLKQLLIVLHHVTHAQTQNTVSSACPGAPHRLLTLSLHRISKKKEAFFPLLKTQPLCRSAKLS